MTKFKRYAKKGLIYLAILISFMYLNNTSLFTRENNGEPFLLAHRGMAQTFPMEGITGETCTAEIIYKPEHPSLENTLPSMEAAFQAGADIVEFDIQLTKDENFAVFHDWEFRLQNQRQRIDQRAYDARTKTIRYRVWIYSRSGKNLLSVEKA